MNAVVDFANKHPIITLLLGIGALRTIDVLARGYQPAPVVVRTHPPDDMLPVASSPIEGLYDGPAVYDGSDAGGGY